MKKAEDTITMILRQCGHILSHVKTQLDTIQEMPLDNDKLKLIENATWCIEEAMDDIRAIVPDKRRFCRGCHADVTDTMYCFCGDFPLTKEATLSYDEMINHQNLI